MITEPKYIIIYMMTRESGICSDMGIYVFPSVHLDGRGQGRSAVASTDVYEFDSVVRGHHAYKTAWTLLIDEMWIPMNVMNTL